MLIAADWNCYYCKLAQLAAWTRSPKHQRRVHTARTGHSDWHGTGSLVSMFNMLCNTKHRCQNVKPIDDFSWVLNSFGQNSYIMHLLIDQSVSSPKEGTSQCTEWLSCPDITFDEDHGTAAASFPKTPGPPHTRPKPVCLPGEGGCG